MIQSSVHKVAGKDVVEAAYDRMADTKEEIVAVHKQEAYGHSYHSCAEGIPCTVGSACSEVQGGKGNPAAVGREALVAAHGASWANGDSSRPSLRANSP